MRNTALQRNRAPYRGMAAANVSQGASVPSSTGGWDAYSPLAKMPAQNAVTLINWFPQPGWDELRKGHVIWCDTGTGTPVDTVMAYMGQDTANDKLFAFSGNSLFDVTGNTPSTISTGYSSNRWQFTDFAGTGGSFVWACNGLDTPIYWDGALHTAVITCVDGSMNPTGDSADNFINVCVYRDSLWCVLNNSTKAYYLPTDSVQGNATIFDVGNQFINGGKLVAIGTFSTDTIDGPNEFICFLSSQGDVAIYLITDPTTADGISLRGRAEISQPVGIRCLAKVGADLAVITFDGVLPLSQVLTYDKAALIGKSITANIRQAVSAAVKAGKDEFGWMLHSYPRSTMAILNVPITEASEQQQYVMNTITGAWAQFVGQNANCWEVFLDRAYFGGNDGVVRLADEAGGDENQTLFADKVGAFDYFGERGVLKRWTMIRPNLTINVAFPVQPQIGMNVDFGTDASLDPINFGSGIVVPLWDTALWDVDMWPGDITSIDWASISGVGYCASIRVTVSVPWSEAVRTPYDLRVNGYDCLYSKGAFI